MKKSDFASRLSQALEARGMKAADLSKKTKVAEGTISCYINGRYEAKQNRVQVFAEALDVNPAWLMGYDVPMEAERSQPAPAPRPIPKGFEPMPKMKKIPLVGSIACGTPILAQQNIEKIVDVPENIRCDFSLTCHGDSMAPTICDGDIVCIRCQPEVEQGEIAAVRIGELKLTTSRSNWEPIQSRWNVWVRPVIGRRRVGDLTEQQLQAIINKGFAGGLSKKYLSNMCTDLTMFCKWLRLSKMSTLRPEELHVPKGARSKEKEILQPEDLRTLFEVDTTILDGKLIEDPYVNAYRFSVVTGLRPQALGWPLPPDGHVRDLRASYSWRGCADCRRPGQRPQPNP